MRNLKKGLLIRVTATRNCRKIFGVLVPLVLFAFCVWTGPVAANDHKKSERHHARYERMQKHYDDEDTEGRRVKRGDQGNEN